MSTLPNGPTDPPTGDPDEAELIALADEIDRIDAEIHALLTPRELAARRRAIMRLITLADDTLAEIDKINPREA